MPVKEEFKNIKEIVTKILEEDPRCRNDDKWLTYKVMSHFTRIFIPFEDFKIIPSFETIARSRRLIQASGEFLPCEKVSGFRKQRDQEFREVLNEQRNS